MAVRAHSDGPDLMKTILCYGDSNTWGAVPLVVRDDVRRFGFTERWPGVLRQQLGGGYWVIEEGLNGRTTVHDDPIEGAHKNGRTYLEPCLESHHPIDLVIVMLGTNDLKARFAVPAADIAAGAGALAEIVLNSAAGPAGGPPRLLLMCPPPLAQLDLLADMFAGGREKSQGLSLHYRAVAEAAGCAFLDAGDVIACSAVDGIHFDADAHGLLGKRVAKLVPTLLPD